MKKNKNDIIYSLNVEDVQTVALEEFDRELTAKEIEMIEDAIAENINWYDAIYYAIDSKLVRNNKPSNDY